MLRTTALGEVQNILIKWTTFLKGFRTYSIKKFPFRKYMRECHHLFHNSIKTILEDDTRYSCWSLLGQCHCAGKKICELLIQTINLIKLTWHTDSGYVVNTSVTHCHTMCMHAMALLMAWSEIIPFCTVYGDRQEAWRLPSKASGKSSVKLAIFWVIH